MSDFLFHLTNSVVYLLMAGLLFVIWKLHVSWRTTVWRFIALAALTVLLQTIRILDENGYGWKAVGSDFSSHGAGAFGISLLACTLMPRLTVWFAAANVIYWILMIHHGYHSIGHLLSSLLIYGALGGLILVGFVSFVPGFLNSKSH